MNYIKFIAYLILNTCISSSVAGSYEDFFQAVRLDRPNVVAQLLQRGFDPNSRDESGQTAMTLAAREGSIRVLDLLLRHPKIDLNAHNRAGESALMMVALKGHTDMARRMIEQGASIHQPGWSPLHYAAVGPDAKIADMLLDRGVPIDARAPNGSTPLMMAAQYGGEVTVIRLLERRADARLVNTEGLNAADFARIGGRTALADRLSMPPR
jgi:uncharacterized protein